MTFDEHVVLVTGSSRGLGEAFARCIAAGGATVVVNSTGQSDRGEAVARGIRDEGGKAVHIAGRVEDSAALVESVVAECGAIDGIVHNAGILGQRLSIEQQDITEWFQVMHVNVTVPFVLTQALFPLLRKSEDPSIIFTSSGVGRRGIAFWGAYSVSKFATEGLSEILADEHRQGNLRSNCVNPGATRTKMRLAAYPAEDRDKLKRPEDILASYIFLLGPDSKGVTGESLDAQ